jgi:hypothetical protein
VKCPLPDRIGLNKALLLDPGNPKELISPAIWGKNASLEIRDRYNSNSFIPFFLLEKSKIVDIYDIYGLVKVCYVTIQFQSLITNHFGSSNQDFSESKVVQLGFWGLDLQDI